MKAPASPLTRASLPLTTGILVVLVVLQVTSSTVSAQQPPCFDPVSGELAPCPTTATEAPPITTPTTSVAPPVTTAVVSSEDSEPGGFPMRLVLILLLNLVVVALAGYHGFNRGSTSSRPR